MSRPASPIGHGALGLRSNLRSFLELTEQSYCERRAYADVRFGQEIRTSWSSYALGSPGTYTTTLTGMLDGAPLEVASVAVSSGETLTRARTIAACSEGHFYPDLGDPSGTLYVNLTGGLNPNEYTVEVSFVRRYGSVGSVEPLLVENLIGDPEDLTGYGRDNEAATGVTIAEAPGDVPEGSDWETSFEIRPGGSGLAGSSGGGIYHQDPQFIVGEHVFIPGAYKTTAVMPNGLSAALRVELSLGVFILGDGRNTGSVTDIPLANTGGEWRRFLFVLRAPNTTSVAVTHWRLVNTTGGAITEGSVRFAELTVNPVLRYEMVEPRLASGALPAIEQNAESPFMADDSVGLASIALLNSDSEVNGYELEDPLGDYDIVGRDIQLYQGGTFDDGTEILWPDVWACYKGSVDSLEVGDEVATLSLKDSHSIMSTVLPVATLSRTAFGDVADRDLGRPRPIIIGGPKYGMRPPRIGLDGTTGLPIFEVNDPTYGNGTAVMDIVGVWAYTDEDAANRRDTTRRRACVYATDTTLGRVSISENPGPFVVIGGSPTEVSRAIVGMNDSLDFDTTGGVGMPFTVYLTPGLYTAATLAAEAQTQMNAATGGGVTVSYSNTTHAVTIAYAGASLSLLLSTGATKHRSAYALLGFEGTADLTGALSYTGTVALYDSGRADQIVIRIDASGYRDNTDGRYTGITGGGAVAIIYKAPDALRFILHRILQRPTTEIDNAEFVAARGSASQPITIYLGGLGPSTQLTVQEIIDRVRVSCHADLPIDGAGVLHWRQRVVSSSGLSQQAASAPILGDDDFLGDSFRCVKKAEDTYSAVSIRFDEDAVTGETKTREANNDKVGVRHGQVGRTIDFDSILFYGDDVQTQAWNQMLLAVLPRRYPSGTVKGRLVKKLVSDLVRIQRTRMLGSEEPNMLNADVFRLLSLSVDPQTWNCTLVAYTADLPRNADISINAILRKRPMLPRAIGPTATRDIMSTYKPGFL